MTVLPVLRSAQIPIGLNVYIPVLAYIITGIFCLEVTTAPGWLTAKCSLAITFPQQWAGILSVLRRYSFLPYFLH